MEATTILTRGDAERRELRQWVVARAGQGGRNRGEGRCNQQQGVTIGRTVRDRLRTNRARSAHPVLHHHGGGQQLCELLGHQATHSVRACAGCEGHNDADRTLGPGLRPHGGCGQGGQRRAGTQHPMAPGQKVFHGDSRCWRQGKPA